jgi:predicted phage terminase large subunit-like protein
MKWDVVYKTAYNEDGTAFFPEKLSLERLEEIKRSQGIYIFTNQYLNKVIPTELQTFKRDWLKIYTRVPRRVNTFMAIDPALSEADTADNTGIVVVDVDAQNQRYVRYAKRHRVNPTELIDLIFRLHAQFNTTAIGVEQIAYQKALLYFLDQEMRRRNTILPVEGIKYPPTKSKQTRILSLVPYFEYGRMLLNQGLQELEQELLEFPRGRHDDLIDALAQIDYLAYPPTDKEEFKKPHSQHHADYEKWYIHNLQKNQDVMEE